MPNNPGLADWRVVFARTTTDATVASFECEISKLGRYVSPKVGLLEARIPIPNLAVGADAHKIIGGEGKLSMYAYRDNQVWWGGFLDSISVDSGEPGANVPVLTVRGASFESYPDRREARTDETLSMDQTAFAKFFWDRMQSVRGGNVRVQTPTPKASGKLRAMSWKRSDVRTVGSLLKELSNRVDGFEWIIDCFEDDTGMRRRELVTGYPEIGRPDFGYVMTYPGNILTYEINGEAMDGALAFQARGKAPDPVGSPGTPGGGGGTAAVAQDPAMSDEFFADDLINDGYTRVDATVDRPTVTQKATLDDWARLARDMRSGPLVLPSLVCRMEGFNQAILGSTVKVAIRDFPFPTGRNGEPGWSGAVRVIGYEIDPGEFGGEDIVRLVFENPRDNDNLKRNPN